MWLVFKQINWKRKNSSIYFIKKKAKINKERIGKKRNQKYIGKVALKPVEAKQPCQRQNEEKKFVSF